MRADLPRGTVTFLFTDVEGSTRLLREIGAERYAAALDDHRRLVRSACTAHDGVEVDTQGDAFFLAFPTATGAVAAAEQITAALDPGPIRLRIGVHTGVPLVTEEGYVGEDVHLAARVAAAGHGGQILLTEATAALAGRQFVELGEHRLKDVEGGVRILQVGTERFPALRTASTSNLPVPASSFVGRVRELTEVLARVADGARLLTFTGPGGSGKTRLAVEAARALAPGYEGGAFWAGLATLRDPALVHDELATALGARDSLAAHIGGRRLLVVVDNFEQVVDAAPQLSALLSACPGLTLLVTSRELLRVQGEVEIAVPPLAEPDAVELFCARSGLEPSEEIHELCARLDSLPLAVELAAARARALSPAQILERLRDRLELRAGRDADPRQQTLRSTIAWSHELLSQDERRLFARLSVFAGGCRLEDAESVADADVGTLQSLVEKSLLRRSGERYAMLETIREFAAEQLDPDEREELLRRLTAHVVEVAEASTASLHTAEESAVSARLAPDYANVREAVTHALAAGDPEDAAFVLGGLYPFLISHGHLAEAREWVDATLARRDCLSPEGLAEALVAGGELARFAGDLEQAVALKAELVSASGEPRRPRWRAATYCDLSEIALDLGDSAAARGYAEQGVAAGAGARAELCFAELALRAQDLDAAASHSDAALAGLEPGAFNHACGLEIRAETARRAGDGALADELFRASLHAFAALEDGGGIADCLDGLARLAADAGERVRAGRLLGAAGRLRETRGRTPTRTDAPLPHVSPGSAEEGRALTLEDALDAALLESASG
ncbi:MAG TPA: adenylate/guanylate cyclase domain-containing protein [Gaiella sp.]|nr:adenylate/guanylate cyclase domain-containing protein [Gaiella sp.]